MIATASSDDLAAYVKAAFPHLLITNAALPDTETLPERRCPHCDRLLFKGSGHAAVQCACKCHRLVRIDMH